MNKWIICSFMLLMVHVLSSAFNFFGASISSSLAALLILSQIAIETSVKIENE